MFDLLFQGFAIALQPENLAFIALGVVIGQIVGALPGLGPAAGMALLLPLTFGDGRIRRVLDLRSDFPLDGNRRRSPLLGLDGALLRWRRSFGGSRALALLP